jgi:hypothetical protein
MSFDRRIFFKLLVASPVFFIGLGRNEARAKVALTESDPTAQALCFKLDVKKVDKKDPKCSRFESTQNCANCQLYQAKPTDKTGPCTIFQNKIVPAQGWCSAWVKRA